MKTPGLFVCQAERYVGTKDGQDGRGQPIWLTGTRSDWQVDCKCGMVGEKV